MERLKVVKISEEQLGMMLDYVHIKVGDDDEGRVGWRLDKQRTENALRAAGYIQLSFLEEARQFYKDKKSTDGVWGAFDELQRLYEQTIREIEQKKG